MISRLAKLTLILAALVVPEDSFAQSITIQGRVVNSSGTPVSGSATKFRVQILSPNANRCVLFDETHVLDLSTSSGLFSINLNNGLGTRDLPTTYSLEQALSNRAGFAVNSSYCASGSGTVTYAPSVDDNRKVVIQFQDPGTMTSWETIPEMDLNPIPYSIESRSVGGYTATSLLRVVDGSGNPAVAAPLTTAQLTEMQALIGGTSNNYMSSTSGTSTGARLPTVSGNPSSPAAGSIWFDTGSGAMKYYDGSTVQTVGTGTGAGTITGVTAGTGLTGGGTSGTVTVSLGNSGVTAATYGSASAVPVLTVDAYGRITSASTTAITGVLPAGTAGQFLKSDGTSWTSQKITMGDLKSTISGDLFSSPGCTAAQSLYWDSGTDQLKCQNIAINASALTAGTIADARLADVGTAGTYKVVTTDAKGRVTSGSNPTTLSGFGITDAVVNAGGIPTVSSGLLSARPAFGTAGRLYVSTDNLTLYRDNGASWDVIGAAGGGTTITEVSAGTGLSGGGTSGNVTLNLTNVGTAGTYAKVTTDAQGRVTSGTTLADTDIPNLNWSKINAGKPTTLAGYGITDAVANAGGTVSFQAGASGSRPAFGTAGRFYYSTNTNILSYDSGTAWVDLTNANAGVASVNVTAPITNSGTGTAPNIGIAQASGSTSGYLSSADFTTFTNKLGTALNSALIWVGNGSNVATPVAPGGDVSMTNAGAFTVTKIQGTAVTSTAPSTGQFFTYNGTNWAGKNINLADLKSTSSGTPALFPAPGCTAAQALYWDSGTDQIKCQNIALNASAITGGTIDAARLPAEATTWTVSGSDVYRSGGKVGIGVTSPQATLDVASGFTRDIQIQPSTASGNNSRIEFRHADNGNTNALYAKVEASLLNGGAGRNEGSLSFWTAPSGTGNPAAVARMVIDPSGNVGINSATPSSRLDVLDSGVNNSTLAFSFVDNEQASTLSALPELFGGSLTNNYQNGMRDFALINRNFNSQAGTQGFSFVQQTGTGSFATLMYLNGDTGNVSIGTTSTTGKLRAQENAGRYVSLADTLTTTGTTSFFRSDDNAGTVPIVLDNLDSTAAMTQFQSIRARFSYSGGASTPVDGGELRFAKEQSWTSTASTQDSSLSFFTTLDGTLAEKMRITSAGNVGIGTTAPSAMLEVAGTVKAAGFDGPISGTGNFGLSPTVTATSGVVSPVQANVTYSPSGATSVGAVVRGLFGSVAVSSSSDMTNSDIRGTQGSINFTSSSPTVLGNANALYGYLSHGGTGTINSAFGTRSSVNNVSTGTIGMAAGLYTEIANAGGGTITNGYGLFIGTIQATNKWSLYASDANAPSYFAGRVGIGTATPAFPLHVTTTTTSTAVGDTYPAYFENKVGPASASSASNFGTLSYAASTTNVNIAGLAGAYNAAHHASTGTAANVNGTVGVGRLTGTGTATAMAGGSFSVEKTGAGTITNGYGIVIPTVAGTNKWAVYASAAAPSYFNGNVSIGTDVAGSPLTVQGSGGAAHQVLIDSSEIKLDGTGYTHYSLMGAKSGRNYFSINNTSAGPATGVAGTPLFTITPTGYVGIGTTNPRELLDLNGGHVFHSGGVIAHAFNAYYDTSTWKAAGYGGSAYSGSLGFNPVLGEFYLASTTAANASGTAFTFASRMLVKKNGAMGINNDTPVAPLDVKPITGISETLRLWGLSSIEGGQITLMDGVSSGNGAWELDNYGTDGQERFRILRDKGENNLSEPFVINYNGTVGINNATPGSTTRLAVSGNAGQHGILAATADGGSYYGVYAQAGSYSGALARADGYAFVGTGNVWATGNGMFNQSDGRYKEHVTPLDRSLDTILKLRPVSYTWKKDSEAHKVTGDKAQFGLIAQEVQKVIPDIVILNKKPPTSPNKDGSKSLDEKLGESYGVEYTKIIPFLIKAVQELKGQLDAALDSFRGDHAEIAKLKTENAEMKAYLCAKDPQAPFCPKRGTASVKDKK